MKENLSVLFNNRILLSKEQIINNNIKPNKDYSNGGFYMILNIRLLYIFVIL